MPSDTSSLVLSVGASERSSVAHSLSLHTLAKLLCAAHSLSTPNSITHRMRAGDRSLTDVDLGKRHTHPRIHRPTDGQSDAETFTLIHTHTPRHSHMIGVKGRTTTSYLSGGVCSCWD